MAKLTINAISIENFGPFHERQNFDFSVYTDRPVILVKALNGSGKTTLLTALQICLYGYKAVNPSKKSDYDNLIIGLRRMDALGSAKIEMQLTVEVGAYSQAITIRREWAHKENSFRENFRVFIQGVEDLILADEWEEFINGILPVELAHLFLFDGEKIEALANPDRLPELLKRATEAFLGLGGIDALAGDLKAVERRTGSKKNLKDDANEPRQHAEQLKSELEEVNQRIEMLAQSQAANRSELDVALRRMEAFKAEAQRNGLHAYQQAAELHANLDTCREKYDQCRKTVIEVLEHPLLPLAWLGTVWTKYQISWQNYQDVQTSRMLADQFSNRDRRILEQLADAAPDTYDLVSSILRSDLNNITAVQHDSPVMLQGGNPEVIGVGLKEARAALRTSQASFVLSQRNLEKAQRAVGQIPAQEQLASVFEQMQSLTLAVSTQELKLQDVSRQLDEAYSKQSHIESRFAATWQRIRTELKENAFQLKALHAADRAKAVLNVFRDRLLASKAAWLSQMITAEFKQLLRKQNLISQVLVEPSTYSVSIEDVNGHSLPMERLSAGERQILAIAVLSALIRERKGRFPVVVDTPLARLDRKHREALITKFFARISHQVLVLSTDEEVEGSVYTTLERHMSREYSLVYNDQERRSIALIQNRQLTLEDVSS